MALPHLQRSSAFLGLEISEALAFVSVARRVACPNPGFVKQLEAWCAKGGGCARSMRELTALSKGTPSLEAAMKKKDLDAVRASRIWDSVRLHIEGGYLLPYDCTIVVGGSVHARFTVHFAPVCT